MRSTFTAATCLAAAMVATTLASATEDPTSGSCKAPEFLSKVSATPNADPRELVAAASPLGDMVYGSADAPVTVVEYSSLTCVFCAQFHRMTFPLVMGKYVRTGKVRWIMREFVGDRVAMAATRVARCAAGKGAGPYEEGLFRRQTDFVNPVRAVRDPMGALAGLATTFGMDRAKFDACRENLDMAFKLRAQKEDAERRFLILGTPTFFVDGKAVTGNPPIEEWDELLSRRPASDAGTADRAPFDFGPGRR